MKAEFKSKLNRENRTALQDVIPLETPFLLYVDPASACNFRCSFCPTGHVDLVRGGTYQRGILHWEIFEKMIDDLCAFDDPLRVMRFNKIGEPLLNKKLPDMIRLAKQKARVGSIDFATNGALLSESLIENLVDAGLDRMNISLEGINAEQYKQHAKVDIDFDDFVTRVKWLYANKGRCEITIKIPANYINDEERTVFLDTFGDHCDRIFVEELASIWPEFDVGERSGLSISETHQYSQANEKKDVCTYIFYAMSVNADGTVSACCPDWNQKLLIGDVKEQSLKEIWQSQAMQDLRVLHLQGKRCDNDTCRSCGHIDTAQVDNIDAFKADLLERLT